jgi:hypothetical protein
MTLFRLLLALMLSLGLVVGPVDISRLDAAEEEKGNQADPDG